VRRITLLIAPALTIAQLQAADITSRPQLAYSKTFGGSGFEYGNVVAADSTGNIYVAGHTASLDFPVKNALQGRPGGVPLRASADGGKTWTTPSIPESVFAVAGSLRAPGVLYAGTSRTIYKSADAGKTWTALVSAPSASVNALIADPGDANVLYAGTSRGLFQSRDAGATWRNSTGQGWNVLGLAMNPSRPSTLLATVSLNDRVSVYRTTDSGATWVLLSNAPFGAFSLTHDPASADAFYAAASPQGFSPFAQQAAIYKSSDAGSTWTKLTAAPVAVSTFALAAGPGAVFAATTGGLIMSRDGGATWSPTSLTYPAENVAVDPANPQTVYASASSIFQSTDGGAHWTESMPVRQTVQAISIVPGGGVFVGATPGANVFLTKWSADGRQMLYSTYLGGSYFDYVTGLAVDRTGNAYVSGYTYSTDFPVTRGALQSKTAAAYTGFVAKVGPGGDTLAYSTYLGGSAGDAVFALAIDGSGSAYVTGYAGSDDFPITRGAYQSLIARACAGRKAEDPPTGDAFVAKVGADGSSLLYSTFLGGGCNDEGLGIALDSSGGVYVVGETESSDFPTTKGVLQKSPAGPQKAS